MAHQFDTGLPMAQRTKLRVGVVDLLANLKKSNGLYLQAVEQFGGVVRGYTDDLGIDQLWTKLMGRSPSIAVALGDRTSEAGGIGGFAFKGVVALDVYILSMHLRDDVSGRLAQDVVSAASNSADPGIEVIMEHVEQLIVGQYPGSTLSIKQVVPRLEEELRTEAGYTLWAQRFAVRVDRVIDEHRNLTQLLTGFRTEFRTIVGEEDDPILVTETPGHVPP